MQRYNLTKKLIDLEEDSESSVDSVIYISSDSENEVSSSWDSDWSTDTEEIIERIEREVKAAPIPIARRGMTTEEVDDEMAAGPSSALPVPPSTPKLGFEYFNKEMCLAPSKRQRKSKVELCATVLPVLESPQSPPDHERGPSIDTPLFAVNLWIFLCVLSCAKYRALSGREPKFAHRLYGMRQIERSNKNRKGELVHAKIDT